MNQPTYTQYTYWKHYQQFLPKAWRFDTPPEEAHWQWNNHTIHLDMMPHQRARAVILLLHGGGGNGRILMSLAPELHRRGYTIVAPDLPGYGLTICPKRTTPTYHQWAQCAADLAQMLKTKWSLPVWTFGLSLGGFLAYLAATHTEAIHGVIATTMADTRSPRVWNALGKSPVLGTLSRPILQRLPQRLESTRLPIRWVSPMHKITNHRPLSRIFSQDPLAGGTSIALGFLKSLLTVDVPIEPEAFTRPVLCVHPTQDPWTPATISRSFFDRIGGPKTWVDLDGCGHFPYEEPGSTRMFDAIDQATDQWFTSH